MAVKGSSLTLSIQYLKKVCLQSVWNDDGLRSGSILARVRDATVTLRAVLAGQHTEEVRVALQEAEVEESAWWAALCRVIQGECLLPPACNQQGGQYCL